MKNNRLIELYLEEVKSYAAKNTVLSYARTLKAFHAHVREKPFSRDAIIGFMNNLRKIGNSDNTIRTKITHIKLFMKWCKEQGHTDKDYGQGVKLPSPSESVSDYLNADEVTNSYK